MLMKLTRGAILLFLVVSIAAWVVSLTKNSETAPRDDAPIAYMWT